MNDRDIEKLAKDCRFELRKEEIGDLRETFRLLETMVHRMDDVLVNDTEEMVSPIEEEIPLPERMIRKSIDPEDVSGLSANASGGFFRVPGRKP